jgi:MFS family permease
MTGSKMQATAILWHVSLLAPYGHKGLALGIVGLTKVIPFFAFSMIGGVIADAFNRRKLMIITQTGMMISSGLLTVYAFSGMGHLPPVYILSALLAMFSSFDAPARHSLIPFLVPRSEYPLAISVNSMMMKFSSVIGPALGGLMIAVSGVKGAYLFNAVSFAGVIYAAFAMRGLPIIKKEERGSVSLSSALEGLRFVFGNKLIKATMLLDFFGSFFASATVLVPVFAQDILHAGPHEYGILMSATPAGALLASVIITHQMKKVKHKGQLVIVAVGVFGFANAMFGVSTSFWLSFFFLALAGAADSVSALLRGIIRQMSTPDHLRGRMVSVNMMFMQGGPQLGELEAGIAANAFGASLSVISGGIACVVTAVVSAWKVPMLLNYGKRGTASDEDGYTNNGGRDL